MSLLTQFYNCTSSGGSTFPDGVPSMSVGGVTANPVTQAYYTNVAGNTISTNQPALTPQAGGASAGFNTSTSPINGRSWWISSTADLSPLPRTTSVSVGHALNPSYDSGWSSGFGAAAPVPTLVFENIATRFPSGGIMNINNIGAIYGSGASTTTATTVTADSNLVTWAYGWIYLGHDFTFTAANLTDVSKSVFLIGQTGLTINFSGCKLSSASVDKILTDNTYVAGSGWTGTLNLGGTCSAPTATGLAAKAILQANGFTVTTN